ncbi:MAG: glycosyltransferase family 2 protein, partial [Lachnospiraceae bacterium]|nr:glycosyltransferase family 2 protein [Lachnospiraceae bacterium]
VTIAHQDDLYDECYVEKMLNYLNIEKKPLIYFTDYNEIRNGEKVETNKLLRIKRIMLFPLKFRIFWNSKFIRRRILSLGSPICCPSVTYVKENLMNPIFMNHFRTNEDWEAWENISKLDGAFVYCSKPLTFHRIHEESETSAAISETGRAEEDLVMYRKFWPTWIARILTKLYGNSEKSNQL